MKKRTPAIEDTIVDGISRGITLRELCRDLKIGRTTVHGWMEEEAFAARMARARALGFDALVDEMIEIADDSRNDWVNRKDAKTDAPPMRNPETVARSRLRIETRMRILSRWYPMRFGGMADRIGGMGGITGVVSAQGQRAGEVAGGASRGPIDTTAIAARLSSILSTIAARDPDGGLEDGGLEWDGTTIEHRSIEHDDMGPEEDA